MKYIFTKHVSIISFINKDVGQPKLATCVDNSKLLLHAAFAELNLIQIVTYIYPLQMRIKTLRAQMGSKTLTRVPLMKLRLQVRLKHRFPFTLAASASLYQCQVSIVVRKKHRANYFQAICKNSCIRISQHA